MSADRFDELEKKMHAALRAQPSLRAPSSLEQRVRAQIAQRVARPWWQGSFMEWPVLPKAAFVAISVCAACICIAGTLTIVNGPGADVAAAFLLKLHALHSASESMVTTAWEWLGAVSPGWWYLAGGVMAAAYVGVLGLGATAYRLLWKAR